MRSVLSFLARPWDWLGRRAVRALNHVLASETWARERLVPHAGKAVSIAFAGQVLQMRISPAGGFDVLDNEVENRIDVSVLVPEGAWQAILERWRVDGLESATLKQVRLSGDAELAQALSSVFKHVRWDVEEDLAGWVGDATAHLLVDGARRTMVAAREMAMHATDQVVEGLVHERPILVARMNHAEWKDELRAVRERLDRLDKRVQRLGASTSSS